MLESVLSGQAKTWLAVWTALSERVALCHSLRKTVLLFNSVFDFISLIIELGLKRVLWMDSQKKKNLFELHLWFGFCKILLT